MGSATAHSETALDPGLTGWIERTTGGTVTVARRVDRWRANWTVDVKTTRSTVRLFVKVPRLPSAVASRSFMLSTYGTRREAAALRVLRDTPVDAPRVFGFHEPSGSLLVECLEGSGYLLSEPYETRRTLMGQYARQLAALHGLTDSAIATDELGAPGHTPGTPGPLAAALRDFEAVKAQFVGPDPLVDIALGWLRQHAPADGTTRMLHGDAGPNQFMFRGDELIATVDWEVSHLGDPMSDIGYTRFRESLYPTGTFEHFIGAYRSAGGHPIDRQKVDYFTVAAALVLLLGVARDVYAPRADNAEAIQRLWWDAVARRAICEILCSDIQMPPVRPDQVDGSEVSALASLLCQRLEQRAATAGVDRNDTALAKALASALDRRLDTAAAVDAAELLGTHIGDGPTATRQRLQELAGGSEHQVTTALRYFGRRAAARLEALSPLAAVDTWDIHEHHSEITRRASPLVPSLPSICK